MPSVKALPLPPLFTRRTAGPTLSIPPPPPTPPSAKHYALSPIGGFEYSRQHSSPLSPIPASPQSEDAYGVRNENVSYAAPVGVKGGFFLDIPNSHRVSTTFDDLKMKYALDSSSIHSSSPRLTSALTASNWSNSSLGSPMPAVPPSLPNRKSILKKSSSASASPVSSSSSSPVPAPASAPVSNSKGGILSRLLSETKQRRRNASVIMGDMNVSALPEFDRESTPPLTTTVLPAAGAALSLSHSSSPSSSRSGSLLRPTTASNSIIRNNRVSFLQVDTTDKLPTGDEIALFLDFATQPSLDLDFGSDLSILSDDALRARWGIDTTLANADLKFSNSNDSLPSSIAGHGQALPASTGANTKSVTEKKSAIPKILQRLSNRKKNATSLSTVPNEALL